MNGRNSTQTSLINGKPAESISIYDRGLQYGDGLFETIAVIDGTPLLLEKHLTRLFNSAEVLKFPSLDTALLKKELLEFSLDMEKGIIKILLTRGNGGRGYRLPLVQSPNRILIKHPWPEYSRSNITDGVHLRLCDIRLSNQPSFIGSKHLNRLEQIIARSEWDDEQYFEGLLLDEQDHIIEGTMSNIFFINDDTLYTPELSGAGVRGVVREVILEEAKNLGYQISESTLTLDSVKNMQSCFITNSIIGICPVKKIGEIVFSHFSQVINIRQTFIDAKFIADL